MLTKTAKKRLEIPYRILLQKIQYLLSQNILIEGSKFTKDSVLKNEIRKKIYDIIQKEHSIHFSNIKKKVFIKNGKNLGSAGQFIWHLNMLLKFNLIKKTKVKNYTLFFPYDFTDEEAILLFFLNDELNTAIFKILIENKVLNKSDIYKILNEGRNKINYRIETLLEYEIIEKNENNEIFIKSVKESILIGLSNPIKVKNGEFKENE